MDNIKDKNDVNVENIMDQIRENIRKKKSGINEKEKYQGSENNVQRAVRYINSNSDIQHTSYHISSHRHIIGTLLVKGRELIHGETSRYIDPIIWKQKEFNINVVTILNNIIHRLDETIFASDKIIIDIRTDINKDIEERIIHSKQIEGMNYVAFEDKFRSSRDNIKQRQLVFVQFFEHCNNVLDVGCGRGEFIELLKERNIGTHGIDINDDMIDYCKSIGLNVDKIDAISYLEQIDDKSLDGIFMDQVVEHLEPNYLIKMLSLCHKKMIYGHHIVIETINLLSLTSFVNFFYMDLTHNRPIHPETLKFLLESAGFRDIEIRFLTPLPDEARLKKINMDDSMNNEDKRRTDIYNHNIDMLNNTLYGAQDYMIIGKK